MDRKKLSKLLIFLIFFIFVVNYAAMTFYWYSSIWYFDMPMHFLGGFWLGLVFIYLFPLQDLSFKSILKISLFLLLVGIGWEVFEIFTKNYITQNPFNALDTISDIFFDLAGGASAIFYCYNLTNGKNR